MISDQSLPAVERGHHGTLAADTPQSERIFARAANESAAELLIILQEGASLSALAGLTEPLRLANEHAGDELYTWSFASPDGGSIRLANGLEINAAPLENSLAFTPRNVVVLGGVRQVGHKNEVGAMRLRNQLARWSRRGAHVTAIGPGILPSLAALPLARTSVWAHWRHRSVIEELYRECASTDSLFFRGPNLTSCAGELAAYDLALADIFAVHGKGLASNIAETLLIESIRGGGTRQHRPISGALGIRNTSVQRAIKLMHERREDPPSMQEISEAVGVSIRQLERLFKSHVGVSPSEYSRRTRLDIARELLLHTDLQLMEIAFAVGFNAYTPFQKAYKKHFGRNPSEHRSRY
jgi:transcriptional regulator GlxA family with amidase domain